MAKDLLNMKPVENKKFAQKKKKPKLLMLILFFGTFTIIGIVKVFQWLFLLLNTYPILYWIFIPAIVLPIILFVIKKINKKRLQSQKTSITN